MTVNATTDAVLSSIRTSSEVLGSQDVDLVDFPLATNLLGRIKGYIPFIRNSIATVIVSDGPPKTVLINEARFPKARRVHNLVPFSEDFSNPAWTKQQVVITPGISDPLGGTKAFTVRSATGGGARLVDTIFNVSSGTDVRIALWLRRRSGTGTVEVFTGRGALKIPVSLASNWQRFSPPTASSAFSGDFIGIQINGGIGEEVDMFGAQYQIVEGQANQNPDEYVSSGVLLLPFHGAGVDGVKNFGTENGNTVVDNVVIDGTGSNLNFLSYLGEDERENVILNSAVMVTQVITTTAAQRVLSFTGIGTVTLSGTSTAGPLVGTGANDRVQLVYTPTSGSLTLTVSVPGTVIMAQDEALTPGSGRASSWMPTEDSPVTRTVDQPGVPTAGNFNDVRGRIVATIEPTDWNNVAGQIIGDGIEAPLLPSSANSGIQSFDGTSTASGPTGTPSGSIDVAVEWGRGSMQVFSDGIGGVVAPYDGSFNLDQINIGQSGWFGLINNLKIVGPVVLTKVQTIKWDITIDPTGDILTEDFFDTALLMSLFAEKRASESEVPESRFRRGWIGNESFSDNFEIGSKIWLFEQSRVTIDTLNGITSAAIESLQWLLTEGFAINLAVDTVLINGIVTLQIDIFRSNSKVDRRFFSLWDSSGVTNSGD